MCHIRIALVRAVTQQYRLLLLLLLVHMRKPVQALCHSLHIHNQTPTLKLSFIPRSPTYNILQLVRFLDNRPAGCGSRLRTVAGSRSRRWVASLRHDAADGCATGAAVC